MSDTTLPKPTPPTTPAAVSATPAVPTPVNPPVVSTPPAPAAPPTPSTQPSTSPTQPQATQTNQQPVKAAMPVQPPAPAAPQKIPMPPTTVTALSSMSSNTIPTDPTPVPQEQSRSIQRPPAALLQQAGMNPPPQQQKVASPTQTTVLGRPLPQAPNSSQAGAPQTSAPAQTPPAIKPQASNMPPTPPGSSIPQMPQKPPTVGMSGMPGMPPTGAPQQVPAAKAATPATPAAGAPKEVKPKRSILSFLPIIVGVLVLIAGGVFAYFQFFSSSATTPVVTDQTAPTNTNTGNTGSVVPVRQQVPSEEVMLEYWGLWEQTEIMQELVEDFQSENPGIKVRYSKQSPIDYRERVQTAVLDGIGPDIFRFHASWVPMYKQILSPIPETVVSSSQMQSDYYPVVTDQLVLNGQYVGLPLMHDSLVLYYNKDILDTAAEQPPRTWSELRRVAIKLAVKSGSTLQRGGLAIGNTTNTEHFSDILGALILQNEGIFSEPNSPQTRDALLFYTNFVLKDSVWNDSLPSSTVAFARGDVAMMLAPSWRVHDVKAINPGLNFDTAPMPQLSEANKISWATYWAEGISSSSTKKEAAAKFLAFLNKDSSLKKLYAEASTVRNFGPIYPKISLGKELATTEFVAPVIEDGPYAKSWYLNSYTHDNGLNDQMIGYYKIAIDSLLKGDNIDRVLATLDEGVTQVLKQYGVNQE